MSQQVIRWRREHGDFARLLDLMETQLELFHGGERPDYELMLDVMHYMTRYADRFHHAREDQAFQRLMLQRPALAAAVAALNREHLDIAALGRRLVEELRAVMNGAMLPRQIVESQARAYVARLREHMASEEQGLYPDLARLRQEDWFMIDSMIHFLDFGDESDYGYRVLHRQIAQAAGCGCRVDGA